MKRIKNNIYTILIVCIATIVGMIISNFKIQESNIVLIYILGIVVVAVLTIKIWYCIFAILLSIAAFNLFFTEPRYTFNIYNSTYILTFIIIFIIAMIISSLMTKLIEAKENAIKNENIKNKILEFSESINSANNIDEIQNKAILHISSLLNVRVGIILRNKETDLQPYFLETLNYEVTRRKRGDIYSEFFAIIYRGKRRKLAIYCLIKN